MQIMISPHSSRNSERNLIFAKKKNENNKHANLGPLKAVISLGIVENNKHANLGSLKAVISLGIV